MEFLQLPALYLYIYPLENQILHLNYLDRALEYHETI